MLKAVDAGRCGRPALGRRPDGSPWHACSSGLEDPDDAVDRIEVRLAGVEQRRRTILATGAGTGLPWRSRQDSRLFETAASVGFLWR